MLTPIKEVLNIFMLNNNRWIFTLNHTFIGLRNSEVRNLLNINWFFKVHFASKMEAKDSFIIENIDRSTSHSILIPSYVRWPLVTTIVVYSLLYIWIHFIFILLVSWFNDLQIESNEGRITLRVQKTITNGYKIFLISEVMIFFSLIWSFIHLGLVPNIFILMNFPP